MVFGVMLAGIGKTDVVNAEAHRHFLQTAGAILFAGRTVTAVRGKQQLEDHAAVLEEPCRIGTDAQTVFRRHGAGGVDPAGVRILDHAHAAGAVNGKVGVEAEVRHFHAGLLAYCQNRRFAVELHADVIYIHDTFSHRSPPP